MVSDNEGDRNIRNLNANIRSGTKPYSLLSEEETEHSSRTSGQTASLDPSLSIEICKESDMSFE